MIRKRFGFTLIELLVVISIIAVLMAIMMPALSRVRDQGRATVCQSRMRQWGLAIGLYAHDYKDNVPYFARIYRGGGVNNEGMWFEYLAPYIGSDLVRLKLGSDEAKKAGLKEEFRQCPAGNKNTPISIGVNFCWYGDAAPFYYAFKGPTEPTAEYFRPCNYAMIKSPDSVMGMTDVGGIARPDTGAMSETTWVYNPYESGLLFDNNKDGIPDSRNDESMYNRGNPIAHFKGSNVVLMDGHTEWVSLQDLWNEQERDGSYIVPKHKYWRMKEQVRRR